MYTKLVEWVRSERAELSKNALRVIGAYGIIVVFAQDVGVRTGCVQAMLMQNILVQTVIFTAVAYSVTDDFFQSFSGTLIYMILKHVISKGVVNDVCFPGECQIKGCQYKKQSTQA